MSEALTLVDLVVRRGGSAIVRELSTEIEQGTWFGVVGANGSGKTTLLRAIAGRLPIASGTCNVDGQDMSFDRAARAELIGFAPPIEHLPGNLRLCELLSLAAGDEGEPEVRCDQLWEALDIKALLNRRIGEYSSGMRQRASIALAFARPTPIAILDEPFNWLDPVAAFDARIALGQMVGRGLTLVTALHDLATLCGSCDAGMIMADGRSALTLEKDELRQGQRNAHGFERQMINVLRRKQAI